MVFVSTKDAPTPGAYSQGVMVDPKQYELLFLAGQTGNDPNQKDEPVVDGGFGPQTTKTLENILAIVKSVGGDASCIVSCDVFLKNGHNSAALKKSRLAFNDAYKAFFAKHGRSVEQGNMPARFMVWVSEIPLESPAEDTVVEIRAIAAIPKVWLTATRLR